MAEIKNSFLRSKMNKDLDDRLVPNGEYRDAQNISVGKSEDDDIGALETVLGNTEKVFTITPSLPDDIHIIGYTTDEYKDTIYVFATNYVDAYPNTTPTVAPSTNRCIIYSWTPLTPNTAKVIADGVFLNFSTTNPIQASLIEDLLFFTDNRNQPRKVNINQIASYYTNEVQISVAKYNPWKAISLIKKTSSIVLAAPAPSTTTFVVNENLAILTGMSIVSTTSTGTQVILPTQYVTVLSAVTALSLTTVTTSEAITAPSTGDIMTFMISTMTNKSDVVAWPGDPDYLEDRFVRFSYRYRFDDGEYSIMAPYTQIAYIPKQKGYFKNGDENEAYRSTIVKWMENNINNIELLIDLPDDKSRLESDYKIKSLDILYKESDALAVKVLETIPVDTINTNAVNNIYTYEYQSRKPYKTLPQVQTTRVYDKVPVRSLAQETAGNRIIYGNFRNAYSPPDFINYNLQLGNKGDNNTTSWIEYPNHSLKQNRNYQVGFILCDKFGRQSSVILSPVTAQDAWISGELGSTAYVPYNTAISDVLAWFGDTLQISVTNVISSGASGNPNFSNGEPGLYANATGNGQGWTLNNLTETTVINNVYTFRSTVGSVNLPVVGDFLRGAYTDFVEIITVTPSASNNYSITTGFYGVADVLAVVNDVYKNNYANDPDDKFAYTINETGWYSYKVVVKQTEQDYYNVYLPGILDGYPDQDASATIPFPGGEDGKTANIVLINDNINKVPRDLTEVGPDQKQFRSSVQLFGRVENSYDSTAVPTTENKQYFPGNNTDTAISIATANDSNMTYATLGVNGKLNLYQIDSNPLIARLSTNAAIGVTTTTMRPYLAIYETEPVESLLDIFWETDTVGLIADLNADVLTGYEGPVSFSTTNIELLESDALGHSITDWFSPVSSEGTIFNATYPTTATLVYSCPRGTTNQFVLEQNTVDKSYRINTSALFMFDNESSALDVFSFEITVTVDSGSGIAPGEINTIPLSVSLTNVAPAFNNNPLVDIQCTVDQVVLPGQDTSAANGTNASNTVTNKIEQLKWSILSGNPTGANSQPAFVIAPTTGQLTQTANNSPNGQHQLTLKIEDAIFNNVAGPGSLNSTQTQNILVGPEPTNAQIKSGCTTTIDSTGPSSVGLITNGVVQNTLATGVWYIAAAVVADVDLPVTPSTPVGVTTQTKFRLGSGALTQGQIVFSLNGHLRWAATPPPSGLQGDTTWKIWHRATSLDAWAHISDINNQTLGAAGLYMEVDTASSGTLGNFYTQAIFAFDQVGEYAIAAVDAQSTTSDSQAQAFTAWVNSNDLNYSTCVIENGVNVTSGTAINYEYRISTTGSGSYNCLLGFDTVWSNVPYGQYVPQFFTTTQLQTYYTFADAGAGISNYRAFKTTGSSPYNDSSNDNYAFSTRFTVADAKVYIPNPWAQCYTQNCGNTSVATTTCTPLQMKYPY